MKCDIIRDLLPLYADNLTSEASNEEIREHLEACGECARYYEEMKSPESEEISQPDEKEIDYLTKIKRGRRRTAMVWAAAAAVTALILVKMFALGFRVDSRDMEMESVYSDGGYTVHFNLTNGHDLIMRSSVSFVAGEAWGYIHEYEPRWVFHNPFDDVGTGFSLGGETKNADRVVVNYADKSVEIVMSE